MVLQIYGKAYTPENIFVKLPNIRLKCNLGTLYKIKWIAFGPLKNYWS